MLVNDCRVALTFDCYSYFLRKWTCIKVWHLALRVAKRYGASVSEIHFLTGCSLTLEMLRLGPLFGHLLTLGPILKDTPRRALHFALENASKHASSEDFEAFFCLTLNSNIVLQKLQLCNILRCPSCINQAPQAEIHCYCKVFSNFNAICQNLTNIVVTMRCQTAHENSRQEIG